jgi:hypothetical protein
VTLKKHLEDCVNVLERIGGKGTSGVEVGEIGEMVRKKAKEETGC